VTLADARGTTLNRTLSSIVGAPAALRAGLALLGFWVVVALAAPLIAPFDPIAQDISRALLPPSLEHPFGTDNFGRDVLSRVIWGTRLDLLMGIGGVLLPVVIGCTIGLVAGWFGGIIDAVLMRILDVTMAFPFLVLMIAIISVLGPGLAGFFIALALVGWVSYARLIRSQTLILKGADFVTAARTLGYSAPRILRRHILPNAIAPAIVFSMSDMVLVILLGSSLSYLGLGSQPPTPEWGVMIAEGQTFIASAWWICLFPGLAIVFVALAFSLLADGLAARLGVHAA
jgi:peptide/nickel transport system permease protein